MFLKQFLHQNLGILCKKLILKKKDSTKGVFLWISQNTYFEEHLCTTASVLYYYKAPMILSFSKALKTFYLYEIKYKKLMFKNFVSIVGLLLLCLTSIHYSNVPGKDHNPSKYILMENIHTYFFRRKKIQETQQRLSIF